MQSYAFLSEGFLDRLFSTALAVIPHVSLAVCEVSLFLSSDEEIQALNREYRKKDTPTNVLSFPLYDAKILDNFSEIHPLLLGDIVLSLETTEREAKAQDVSLENHTAHLLTHGFLHLLGYDHITDEEAEHMEQIETQCLCHLGYKTPYRRTPDV